MNIITENDFTSFKHNNELITYEIYKSIHTKIIDRISNKKVNKMYELKIINLELNKEKLENEINISIIEKMEDF